MKNEARDKFLTELIGECWHNVRYDPPNWWCDKCKNNLLAGRNNDFSTWEGFGKLFEWGQKQEWYEDLTYRRSGFIGLISAYITPDEFANMVYEFTKKKIGEVKS